MRGKWLLVAGIAIFGGALAGVVSLWRQQQAQPRPVVTAPAGPAPGTELAIQGKIQVQNLLDVAVPVDGTLLESPVRPGDEVAEGQLLAVIKNTTLEEDRKESELELDAANEKKSSAESALIAARLEESRASADASRARGEYQRLERIYQRQQMLNREGATPRRAFEAAEKEFLAVRAEVQTLDEKVEQVRARIEQLVRDVDSTRQVVAEKEAALEEAREAEKAAEVHSPVDGILISALKQPGEEVKRGTPNLFQIGVDLSAMEVVLESEATVVKRIQVGQPALVQMAELPGDGLPGAVSSVADGRVVVRFGSPSPLIRPGMTALVRLKLP